MNFTIDKIIDPELLHELYDDYKSGTMVTSPGNMATNKGPIYGDYRRCTVMRTPVKLWPDIAQQLEQYVGDGTTVSQYDFILYKEGDWFGRHNDIGRSFPGRKWTTVTLMELSDDFEGQGLCLYDGDKQVFPEIKVGETIVFDSAIYHSAEPVVKGERLVLVAWLKNNS